MTRRSPPPTFWSDERIEALTTRFHAGDSFREIGRVIGHGCSRSAAIAKANRLGLHRGATIGRDNNARTKTREALGRPPKAPKVSRQSNPFTAVNATRKPPQVELLEVRADELTPTRDLASLTGHTCRWPIGDPKQDGFGFCGRHKPDLEQPYCNTHSAIAYRAFVLRTDAQKAADAGRRTKTHQRKMARAA